MISILSKIPKVVSYEGVTSSVPSVKADILNNQLLLQVTFCAFTL